MSGFLHYIFASWVTSVKWRHVGDQSFNSFFSGPPIGRRVSRGSPTLHQSGTPAAWHPCSAACWLHRQVWPATAALYDHLLFFLPLQNKVDNDEQLCNDYNSTQTHKYSHTQVRTYWMWLIGLILSISTSCRRTRTQPVEPQILEIIRLKSLIFITETENFNFFFLQYFGVGKPLVLFTPLVNVCLFEIRILCNVCSVSRGLGVIFTGCCCAFVAVTSAFKTTMWCSSSSRWDEASNRPPSSIPTWLDSKMNDIGASGCQCGANSLPHPPPCTDDSDTGAWW